MDLSLHPFQVWSLSQLKVTIGYLVLSKRKVKVKSLSSVRLFATQWTVAYQAPPFMGPSRQEYWSGLPLPSPGDLPDPGIEPGSPALEADALPSEPHKYTVRTYSELSHMLHIIRIIAMCVCVYICVYTPFCLLPSSPPYGEG